MVRHWNSNRDRMTTNENAFYTGFSHHHRQPIRMWLTVVYAVGCLFLTVTLALCPEECTCSGDTQVSCQGLSLIRIPPSLPQQVTTLDLTDNSIRRITIESLVPVRGVVNLKLKQNEIDSIEEGAFHVTDHLQTLDLSSNKLKSIHQGTFTGAQTLLHLDLSNNQLEHVDGAFAEMSQLTRLDLQNNHIKGLSQFTFRDLVSLRYLLLSSNQIAHVDRRAFTNLIKLMYLVLKDNPVGSADNFEFTSNFLSYVDFSECGLRYVPRGLPNSIRYLQLRRNNMTSIQRRDFQTCPYISILVLDENGLLDIEEGTFAPMIYLQQLWLNGNKLVRIPAPLPKSLQRVLMDANQLGAITSEFPENSQINTLSLMGNNISYIAPDAFHRLTMLKSLDMSNNQIQNLYSKTFINSTQLRTLQMAKNPLRYFYSGCFHGLRNLRILTLAYDPNNVTMAGDSFDDLVRLKKMDLDSSPGIVRSIFDSRELIDGLHSVEDLSMQSTDLTHVPTDFPTYFPNLLIFHLTSTRWHCDRSMIWFKDWLQNANVRIEKKFEITCFTPRSLHGRPIAKLEDSDFIPTTSTQRTTTLRQLFPPVPSPSSPPRTSRHQNHNEVLPSEFVTPHDIGKWEPHLPTSIDKGFDFEGRPTSDPYDPFNFDETSGYDPEDEDDEFFDESAAGRTKNPGSPEGDSRINSGTSNNGNSQWSSSPLPHGYKGYGVPNGNLGEDLQIRTLPKHTTEFPLIPQGRPNKNGDNYDPKYGPTSLLVIIAATVSTLVFLAIVITAVVIAIKRHQKKEVYQNAIKYQQRNDVLYFMPQQTQEGTPTESVPTTSTSREQMQLVPGRDINHEGPLRVYKWEDF